MYICHDTPEAMTFIAENYIVLTSTKFCSQANLVQGRYLYIFLDKVMS